jgi:hypothetical protein
MTFTRTRGALAALAVFSFVACGPASAQVTNGGFEQSGGTFTGWNRAGDTLIQTSSLGTGPVEGTHDALLATATDGTVNADVPAGSGVNGSTLETFLGLNAGAIAAVGNGSPLLGSAITQTVNLQAGEQLLLQWNFLTNQAYNDGTSSSYAPSTANNDFAFFTLLSPSAGPQITKLADTFYGYVNDPSAPGGFITGLTITPSTNPFVSETGFHTFSFTASTTGSYTIGIGAVHVTNSPDNGINSAVLVDNVRVVPEPASCLVLGVMALGATVRRRRARRDTQG